MTDRPDAGELIAVARDTLAKDLLPRLPEDLRLTGLMIVRALEIAGREIAAGAKDDFARARAAAGFRDDAALVAALRAGAVPAGLHAALLEEARARVSVANPKYS